MGKTKTKSRSVEDSPKSSITIRSTNPKILDDNIAKLEKAIQASDVSANPSGTAEETLLSTIGIDGKKYELGPSAENTSYDNTDSGLTATDIQGAIDEIAPKAWTTLLSPTAAGTSETIDTTGLKEVYVIITFASPGAESADTVFDELLIPDISLLAETMTHIGGSWATSTYGAAIQYEISKTAVKLVNVYSNATDVTNSARIKVIGR